MSKDIHKWTINDRYTLMFDEHTFFVFDNIKKERMTALETTERLNMQQSEIDELKKNFDDLAEWTSEIAKRNVVLDEQIGQLQRENEQLQQKLECCEYKHFKKELDKIHEKVEKGDLNDFCTLTISDKGLEHWNGVLK